MQRLGDARAFMSKQERDALPPWCVGHLSDAALQLLCRVIAVIDADGILNVAGADGVGQQQHGPCTCDASI